jgi:hypothetical protein
VCFHDNAYCRRTCRQCGRLCRPAWLFLFAGIPALTHIAALTATRSITEYQACIYRHKFVTHLLHTVMTVTPGVWQLYLPCQVSTGTGDCWVRGPADEGFKQTIGGMTVRLLLYVLQRRKRKQDNRQICRTADRQNAGYEWLGDARREPRVHVSNSNATQRTLLLGGCPWLIECPKPWTPSPVAIWQKQRLQSQLFEL